MSQKFKSELELQALNNATTDTDKFLVSDGGVVKYRTGAEMLSDLGVAPGVASNIQHQVKAGVAINKGQAVYVTGADGTNMIVGLASNASEATSSKTMGLLASTVSINGFANVVAEGLLAGLNTIGATAGDPVWLGTGGNLIYGLINKPYAPAHLVFIGIVTRVNSNNGEIFVKVQNGFELKEIHDVDIITNVPINGDVLGYNGTLWVNKTIAGWLGYTPANASGTTNYVSKFTGSTSLGDSQIFDNGTNVGIGTSSPTYKFEVSDGTRTAVINPNSSLDGIFVGVTQAKPLILGTNDTERMRITPGGDVGIGTTSTSSYKLYVNGGQYGTYLRGGDLGTGSIALNVVKNDFSSALLVRGDGNVGIGTTSPSQKLEINGTAYASSDFRAPIFYDSNNTAYYTDPASTSNLASTYIAGHYYGTSNSSNILIRTAANSSEMGIVGQNSSGAFKFQLYGNGSQYGFLNGEWASWDLRKDVNSNLYLNNQSAYYYGTDTAYLLRAYGTADMRAPIFYDLDNTAYYVNPNGTSSLSLVIADNTIKSSKAQTNNDYTTAAIWTESYSATTTGIAFHISGNVGKFLEMRTNGILYWDNAPVVTTSNISVSFDSLTSKTGGTGTYQTNGDFRAPIFYDSNNTTYYLDPAGASVIRKTSIVATGSGWDDGLNLYSADTINRWNVLVDDGATDNLRFAFNNTERFRIGSGGDVTSLIDHRAPIFYDSNNTSYYLDPSSTSYSSYNAGGARFRNIEISNSTYTDTIQNVTSGGNIWINYGHNGPIGLGFGGGLTTAHSSLAVNGTSTVTRLSNTFTTSPHANGVDLHSTGNFAPHYQTDFAWYTGAIGGGTNRATLNSSGDFTANNSSRAPIFYDSNNTAYYTDPFATSSLYDLTLTGTKNTYLYINPGNGYEAMVRYNGGSGSDWYVGKRTTTSLVGTESFHLYSAVAGITVAGVDTGGNFFASQSFRAGVFYDSDDTSYYVNPNATSQLNRIWANKTVSNNTPAIQIRGGSGGPRFQTYGLDANPLAWMGLGTDMGGNSYEHSIYFPTWTGNTSRCTIGDYDGTTYNTRFTVLSNGTSISSGDSRAPIFYDSDNTGYYINPASTSNINVLTTNGNVTFFNQLAVENQSTFARLAFNKLTFWDWQGSVDVVTIDNGYLEATNSLRAPIFYDSNDTGYYLDPNGTSNLSSVVTRASITNSGGHGNSYIQNELPAANNGLGTGIVTLRMWCSEPNQSWDGAGFGYNVYNDGTGAYNFGRPNTNFGQAYMRMVSNGTWYFLTANTSGTRYTNMELNPNGNVYFENIAQSQTSLRAPIFYDSDNTGYYLDPNNTSNLNIVRAANRLTGAWIGVDNTSSATGNGISLYNGAGSGQPTYGLMFAGTGTFGVHGAVGPNDWATYLTMSDNTTRGWIFRRGSTNVASISGGGVLQTDGYIYANTYVQAGGSMYSPIYYDGNNSAYYVDGSSTGDSIRCAGDIVAYYSDERLKDKKGNIENALEKVLSLNGFYYEPNEIAQELGYKKKLEVGVSAQEVEAVLPELIRDAPIGQGYKTLDYGKLTPLLIEAIKEQQKQIEELKELVNKLINK